MMTVIPPYRLCISRRQIRRMRSLMRMKMEICCELDYVDPPNLETIQKYSIPIVPQKTSSIRIIHLI